MPSPRVAAFTGATTAHLSRDIHLVNPDKAYWRNQNKEPGRWPGSLK